MSFNLSHSGEASIVEYQTLSSSNSTCYERTERLHEWLKMEDINALHKIFLAQPDQKLSYVELRDELKNFDINFTDAEYRRLFLKINQNRDFKCDWDEFLSHLTLGFQDDDTTQQNKESLILPISEPPIIKKCPHRSAIVSMTFLRSPTESQNLTQEEEEDIKKRPIHRGLLITASKEGQIKFWTPQLQPSRTCYSESTHLKMPTWILCIQALSDVGIICTSSTERELRFHETIASTFNLRIVIRSMPVAVCTMSYSSHPTKQNSKLMLGDFSGNIRILEFQSFLRGPFQARAGSFEVFWSDILKGKISAFVPTEYLNLHTEMIQMVYYSLRLNTFFTAAEYRNGKKYRGRCPGIVSVSEKEDEKTSYRIPMGCTAFFVDEMDHIFVTGGPDGFVRKWDIFVPKSPTAIMTGHNSGVVKVFIQSDEQKIYSVDYQKIIKVWDLHEHTLLQTFSDLARILPTETELCYDYNVKHRDLLIGGYNLISIKCCPRVKIDITDGNTHSAPVSAVLYNRLFRNVVTCGFDSVIIIWDPWTGRRKVMMKSCHTKSIYGEKVDIEITAACFDPLEQFLLTGARDGSIKIWSYNNAVCVRNMSIKSEHEVTAVIWVIDRILAVGWDRKVTEFNDVESHEYSEPKMWPTFHNDDITCADIKHGEGIVTATYSGEIIFWKLETGHPYRKYDAFEPHKFIELKRDSQIQEQNLKKSTSHHINISRYVRKSVSAAIHNIETKYRTSSQRFQPKSFELENKEEDITIQNARRSRVLQISVSSVLFLQTRPMTPKHGSVCVALNTGVIQVYSHHHHGGFIKEFNGVHKLGDCILTMCTDRKNRYLFTGSAFGYIKIWHIENFCIPEEEKKHICMPLLRLQFIFLRKERFITRAKRVVRHQKEPLLVSSYKGHSKAVNSITYINLPKILLSGSYDNSCRIWSLGGRYLGTLGSPKKQIRLSPFEPVEEGEKIYRMPPDIRKIASSTTIKVITGKQDDGSFKTLFHPDTNEDVDDEEDIKFSYIKPLREPILGQHFSLPGKSAKEQNVSLNTSLSYTPIYTHLKIYDADVFKCPGTPPVIDRVKKEEYMEFYSPPISKKNSDQLRKQSKDKKPTRFTSRWKI